MGTSDEERYFLWFSDIHFDPFFATSQGYSIEGECNVTSLPSIGKRGCDSPEGLVRSAFEAAAKAVADEPSKPSFIIVTGDSSKLLFLSSAHLNLALAPNII
jgi:hypothetical protein